MSEVVEQAARVVHEDHCCPCDPAGCDRPDAEDYRAARSLVAAGLLCEHRRAVGEPVEYVAPPSVPERVRRSGVGEVKRR